ncbi:hypothetical protein [Natronococcus occultus]|uniref:Uncharacterized protein n=1 Tax=Natronococcus occultus SP4 TaxID=694430 RepID=L0K1Z6_9EURY|nr:hypothetical protein [Natronococcus occultus]AGB38138.1 hypothetical protein Natoc_2362 [Natronococcus occultus SP4]
MQTGNAVDERMLERERQLLAVLVLGPLLLVQVVLLYAGFGNRGVAGLVPGLIGLYACGAVAAGVLVDRHRTLEFQLLLSGGLAVLTGTAAALTPATTYTVGAIGFAAATLYYGWRWRARGGSIRQ